MVVFVHVLALGVAWMSLVGWPLALLLFAIAVSLAAVLAWMGRRPVALELHEDGSGAWKDRAGAWHPLEPGRSHFVSPLLVILDLGGGKRLVVPADSAAREDFRRLRVFVRWSAPPSGPERE